MSLRVLFDTNVILDVLLAREPFRSDSEALMRAAERGEIEGVLCATTVTTIDYVVGKARGRDTARDVVRALLTVFAVASVGRDELVRAAGSAFTDFEDAVLHEAARTVGADVIVTRNDRDFGAATLPILRPDAALARLG